MGSPLRLDVGASRVGSIALGEDRVCDSPVGSDLRIVPSHAALIGGVVIPINEVGDGHIGKGSEAVRHPGWNEDASVRVRAIALKTEIEELCCAVGG